MLQGLASPPLSSLHPGDEKTSLEAIFTDSRRTLVCLCILGLREKPGISHTLQTAILLPTFSDIRVTMNCKCWVSVSMETALMPSTHSHNSMVNSAESCKYIIPVFSCLRDSSKSHLPSRFQQRQFSHIVYVYRLVTVSSSSFCLW